MTPVATVRHRVALAGSVTDAETGLPISSAVLAMTGTPEDFSWRIQLLALQLRRKANKALQRPDQTQTREDGMFYFLDLPDGEYTLQASAPRLGNRYGVASAKAVVVAAKVAQGKPGWLALTLSPTGLKGTIKSRKTAVVHAAVRVQGSTECVFTDAQGKYTLTGVEPGRRTLLVQGQGFVPAAQAVSIGAPGQMVTADVSLQHEGA